MKKTKLLTSLAALALVLGLGACEEIGETPTESESTPKESETTPSTGADEGDDESGEGLEDIDEGYRVIFTFYDGNNVAQECPENGSLYTNGNFANPSSTAWGSDYIELTPTTDKSGNAAYYYIFESLVPGATYDFNVVFAKDGDDPAWNPVRSDNFSTVLFTESNEGHTEYVDLTGCYTFSAQFGEKNASCTIAVKDTSNASSDRSLYCSGTMNEWNNSNKMVYDANGTNYQYSYTFDCSASQELEFGIFNNSDWKDSLQIGTDTTGYCSNSGNNVKISGDAIGDNANTLIIFTVDGTNFGSTTTHVTTTAVSITH